MISYSTMVVHVKKNSLKYEDIKTPYDVVVTEQKQEQSQEEIQKQLKEAAEYWKRIDAKRNGKTDN